MSEIVYKYRNLRVVEGEFGRLAKALDGEVNDGTVLNDAIKLAVEKGDHTLFHAGKSAFVKGFENTPTTLAKTLTLDE